MPDLGRYNGASIGVPEDGMCKCGVSRASPPLLGRSHAAVTLPPAAPRSPERECGPDGSSFNMEINVLVAMQRLSQ